MLIAPYRNVLIVSGVNLDLRSGRPTTFQQFFKSLMMTKSKSWLKSISHERRRDTPRILYGCCNVFENIWIGEFLGCLRAFWFNGKKLIKCTSICDSTSQTERNYPFLKSTITSDKDGLFGSKKILKQRKFQCTSEGEVVYRLGLEELWALRFYSAKSGIEFIQLLFPDGTIKGGSQ